MVSCYWPLFDKYLGICSLRTGIYIKSTINLILSIILTVFNIIGISNLVYWGRRIHNYDIPAISDHLDTDITEDDIEVLKILHRNVLSFYIVWLVVKLSYSVVICCTLTAMYKQKPRMFKILLYSNIPNWVFDFILSILSGLQYSIILEILMHIISLSEAYNLLAMRCEYKRMTGKTTPVSSSESPPAYANGFVSPPHVNRTYHTDEQIHCPTCTCNLTPILRNVPAASETVQRSPIPPENTIMTTEYNEPPPEYDGEKELNFKEQPIIYNQHLLMEQQSSIIDYSGDEPQASGSVVPPARPTNLPLATEDGEKKVDIIEIPVIYDENQLNVGSSPIIEDAQ